MKSIGRRDFSKNEIYDIIYKNLELQLDDSILPNEFQDPLQIKESQISIQDISSQVKDLNIFTIDQVSSIKRENPQPFVRAYLLFLIVSIIQQRKFIRQQVLESLISTLNASARQTQTVGTYDWTQFTTQPFLVLLTLYGEGVEGVKIEDTSQLPKLFPQQTKVIQRNCQRAFIISLAYTDFVRTKNAFPLAEVAFALFLDANKINSDFLTPMGEKHSLSRNISAVANDVSNFLANSRLGKVSGTNDCSTWVELTGEARLLVNQGSEFTVEQFSSEDDGVAGGSVSGNSKEQGKSPVQDGAKKSLAAATGKNWTALNLIFYKLITSITCVTDNTLKRLKNDFKEGTNKSLLAQVDAINDRFIQNSALIQDSNGFNATSSKFGSNIVNLFRYSLFFETWENAFRLEAFTAIQVLEHLSKISKAPVPAPIVSTATVATDQQKKATETAPTQINDKQKVSAPAVQKILYGRGTARILDDFRVQIGEKAGSIEEKERLFFENYFNSGNKDLYMYLYNEAFLTRAEELKQPQPPKGTRDFDPKDMTIRKKCFDIITTVFRKHGAVEIDTPVFELKETLMGQYGEDSKLVYDLQDQGGQILSLRYDLTVPFARYMSSKSVTNIKRYHIAKVYRRDQPNEQKGRFREFYQCDFDIAGAYDPMLPDAEILKVIDDILTEINIGSPYVIKVNSRQILDAIVELSGSPKDQFKPICSAIDKLDKLEWKEVRKQLIEEKGLTPEQADKIGEFVVYRGSPFSLLQVFNEKKTFQGSQSGEDGLKDMTLLFQYLEALDSLKNVSFDLSLARGLDYYTGMIFEVVVVGTHVGSISGGGRYDELLGMFSNKQIPAVGGSLGVERIFAIMAKNMEGTHMVRESQTEVLIATVRDGCCIEKLQIANQLWKGQVKTEFLFFEKPKPQKQIEYAFKQFIPFIVLIGQEEIKNQTFQFKTMYIQKDEETLPREELLPFVTQKIEEYYVDLENGKVTFEQPESEEKQKGNQNVQKEEPSNKQKEENPKQEKENQ